MTELKNLVKDIYQLFDEDTHHEPNEENLHKFGESVKEMMRRRLAIRDENREALRFSSMGKPDRQLWYMHNKPELGEKMSAKTLFKFLYGDMIEQVLLFLTVEAGHEVTHEQEEIEFGGVKGHIDAIIDGVVVDVKSASPYSFKKFQQRALFEDDPFGYIGQLSGYAEALTPGKGAAFLVADKVHGDVALMTVDGDTTSQYEPEKRIEHLKEVLKAEEVPPRCYAPVPEGKSGNMKLGVNCSYCPFKEHCWSDANNGKGLRKFMYYNGPVFLTHVAREPNVEEIR